ncbi:MAG: hypothetical protein HRJ53_15545 [Acidobacteria bacterium Pan2503]|uniref:Uncharacterized protein n=1 Tax=Candidatus Acidiferrum panamense TaxID=2741543 RepID=A0A7V8NRZ9_9BACT|nr:hypothetical protein [Candidatus Acidoferrum panamensis]
MALARSCCVWSRADSCAIAETVNRAHPGRARYLEVKGMTHGLTVEKKFQAEMVTIILNWAKEQLAAGKTGTPSSQRSLPISD